MLKILLFSILLAVVLAHDSSSESHEHFSKKQAYCPDAASNSSVNVCLNGTNCTTKVQSMNCLNGTNCTTMNCSSDANCTGIQMCCQTNCGMQCVDPEYKITCGEDDDCPGGLTCCGKHCAAVCANSKPAIAERKKGKKPERKKGKKGKKY